MYAYRWRDEGSGAAHSPCLVRREHAVAAEQWRGAGVIGEDAQRGSCSNSAVAGSTPVSFAAAACSLKSSSVSHTESTPWSTETVRSRPMPVSIDGFSNGTSNRRPAGRTA